MWSLQEVDSLDKLLPALEAAGYNHHYASGPGKKHGCLVAFKKTYGKLEERLIHYDEQHVRSEGEENSRRGASFRTRNIGSLIALKNLSQDGEGVVIGTTHLFWHPKSVIFQFTSNSYSRYQVYIREDEVSILTTHSALSKTLQTSWYPHPGNREIPV